MELQEIKPKQEWTKKEINQYIEQALKEADRKTLKKLDEVATLVQNELNWAFSWQAKEEKLFKKFEEIVAQENTYFKVAHIDRLKLNYDLLIFLAKKNVGKTCEIYRMITETIKRGKKFIYMRLSKDELLKASDAFNNDSNSPVFMFMERQTFKFYSKDYIRHIAHLNDDEEIQITPAWIKANQIPSVGRGYEFMFCQSYTGGQYEDYELIFYDECLSYNPRTVTNDRHLTNWAAFLSSIARNKDNLKVYLFGNLLGTNNAILSFYGIRADDKLRYIVRGGDEANGCRILFINASEFYRGYEAQNRAARHAGGAYALKLAGNEYLKTTTQLIPEAAFDFYEPFYLFKWGGNLIDLRRFEKENLDFTGIPKKQVYWACKCVKFEGYERFDNRPIYTSDKLDLLYYSNLEYIATLMIPLTIICMNTFWKTMRYTDENSLSVCCEIVTEDSPNLRLIDPDNV